MRTIAISIAAFTAASANAGLLVNPGFEPDAPVATNNILPGGSTAIAGWTTIGPGAEWFNTVPFGASSNGGYAVDLASFTFVGGGIEQEFETEIGRSYTVEFEIGTSAASGRVGTGNILVEAAGQSELFVAENFSTTIVWEFVSFTFVATDTRTTLTFSNDQDANRHFANIDGVNIVPAPGAAAAFLALSLASRRRR